MKKNERLDIGLSERDYALIRNCAKLCGQNMSGFILSCVIPLCCKIVAREEQKHKKKNG